MSGVVSSFEKYFTDPTLYILRTSFNAESKKCPICWNEDESRVKNVLTHGDGLHDVACQDCLSAIFNAQEALCPSCRESLSDSNIYEIYDLEEKNSADRVENAAALALPNSTKAKYRRRQLLREMIYHNILIPIREQIGKAQPVLDVITANTTISSIITGLIALGWMGILQANFSSLEFSPDLSSTFGMVLLVSAIMSMSTLAERMHGDENVPSTFGPILIAVLVYLYLGTHLRE